METLQKLNILKTMKKCPEFYDGRVHHQARHRFGSWLCIHCGVNLDKAEIGLAELFG